uniref:Uncharacterized protein n=1 Tax=Trypanosoma congolense (strain IL3000) TaxID=1068625 RepID=G0USC4_TRYCI|nr:hypothetical protein, unlikely [Trypanosoma congolense IL3000]
MHDETRQTSSLANSRETENQSPAGSPAPYPSRSPIKRTEPKPNKRVTLHLPKRSTYFRPQRPRNIHSLTVVLRTPLNPPPSQLQPRRLPRSHLQQIKRGVAFKGKKSTNYPPRLFFTSAKKKTN